ncbi:lipopolysaccharide/colanic/teichoic acid biosynthesis glycosyltransferase [Neisseria sp. HSC-16F19]|nr:exopolysaccharide biosynthesis polyprenyl glycosylphosphotransferase [Neisseria sp. HSC-16F19]MCP2041238.1 lipopolysaccharide/colanic/teichoic acid biosynthesis glycosyltransferase [Neisseria sp. HSC-16F19]
MSATPPTFRHSLLQGLLFAAALLLPALLFWPVEEWFHPHSVNHVSYSVVVISLMGELVTLRMLAQFPGQRSKRTVIPVALAWFGLCLAGVLVWRLPYSVYYLAAALPLSCVFLFHHVWLRHQQVQTLAYIPVSGMDRLPEVAHIRWHALDAPAPLPPHCRAVVTNLHAPDLGAAWQKFLAECTLQGMPVYNIRQVEESLTGRVKIRHMYENDLGSLLPSPVYLWLKQVLDTLFVLVTAPVTVPLMLLTAAAIRLESPGPALFVQNRVGQRGREFTIYKFRSMGMDSERHGAQFATQGDARITRVGRFIRKTRLDELPQFWNILKGEMSLIGPRPEQKAFVDGFEHSIPFYNYRHIVKPGISGWAQVMHGYAADEDATQVKVEHDFYYIKHISFSLDVLIFFKTIKTMLTGFGAR